MTVAQLIELLKAYPQDMQVVYAIYSEQCLLTPDDITIEKLGLARQDGWVHDYRSDQPSQNYLHFRGN